MKYLCVAALSVAVVAAQPMDKSEDFSVEEYDNIFTNFGHFIGRYGHDAIEFLKCMGPTFIKDCPKQTAACVMSASHVKSCLALMACEKHDASVCLHHLKDLHHESTPAAH